MMHGGEISPLSSPEMDGGRKIDEEGAEIFKMRAHKDVLFVLFELQLLEFPNGSSLKTHLNITHLEKGFPSWALLSAVNLQKRNLP